MYRCTALTLRCEWKYNAGTMAKPKNSGQKYKPKISQEFVNQDIGICTRSMNTAIKKQSATALITASTCTPSIVKARFTTLLNFVPELFAICLNE